MVKRRFGAVCVAFGMAGVLMGGLASGCKAAEGSGGEMVSLYDRGLRVVERMDALAESSVYQDMMTSSEEMRAVIKEMGDQDYSSPKAVYQVKMSEETVKLLVDLLGEGTGYDEMPEEVREELKYRMASSAATRFCAAAGAEVLGAASLCGVSDHFIDSGVTENLCYFYVYDGGYWATVTFTPCDEGIVHASGLLIKNDFSGQEADEEEILQWFLGGGGLLETDISRVSP